MKGLVLLDAVLIALIARTPSTGYDLRKHLERRGHFYGYLPQSSQIYRNLGQLVERGLVVFATDTARRGPDAKIYSLTPRGYRAFLDWIDAPFEPSTRPLDAHFPLHFSLAGRVSPVVALRLVKTELAFRLEQEAQHVPEIFDVDVEGLQAPFDIPWAEESIFLADARGNQLASMHISWLRTTTRRLERYIERHSAVWPDPVWESLAAGA